MVETEITLPKGFEAIGEVIMCNVCNVAIAFLGENIARLVETHENCEDHQLNLKLGFWGKPDQR